MARDRLADDTLNKEMDLWIPQAPLLERVKKPVLRVENPGAAILASGFAGMQDTLTLGSDAQLLDLIRDVDALRNEYILDFGKPTSTDFKITIDKLVAECQKLLASSCLIKNNKTRQRFFTTLKKLATDLMTLSTVKDKVHQVVERVRDGDRMNRRRTGFVKELPRWNQFLNKNAPGTNALLLQLRRMLHPKRDAYQVIPRGGIKILQHWDERLHSLTLTIDTLRPSKISLWHKRIEWGHPSMHRLNLGLRTFEPMTFEPSPWNKIDFPTYTNRDISRLDRRIGALMPKLTSRPGGFLTPVVDEEEDAFDCVLTQRFVKRDQQKEEKRKRELEQEKEEKEKEAKGKRRKVVLGMGEAAGVEAT
ncbi:hypothetical protein IWZ01DRAFT_553331 [Phyllosticta capitalensis]